MLFQIRLLSLQVSGPLVRSTTSPLESVLTGGLLVPSSLSGRSGRGRVYR